MRQKQIIKLQEEMALMGAGKLFGHVWDGIKKQWVSTTYRTKHLSIGYQTEKIKTVKIAKDGTELPQTDLTEERYVLNLKRRQRRFLKKAKKNNLPYHPVGVHKHSKGELLLYG